MTFMERMERSRQPCSYAGDYENDPVALLCSEIVIHAIVDWRMLIKSRAYLEPLPNANCNFDELRAFFKSSWCEFIMQKFEISTLRILEILEEELEEAKRKDGWQ